MKCCVKYEARSLIATTIKTKQQEKKSTLRFCALFFPVFAYVNKCKYKNKEKKINNFTC